jgi:hypothetical protein
MPFDFLTRAERVRATNLTIREQVRLATNNPLDLRWRGIFPAVPADDILLSTITKVDFRPAGGRRAWNAQGRELPERIGPVQNAEMMPINPTRTIEEHRLTRIRMRGRGIAALIDADIISDVDGLAEQTANATERQTERDAFQTWFYNLVTVKDPKSNASVNVSAGIDAARYVAAAMALSAEANAYLSFMGYARYAKGVLGSLGGVRLRSNLLTEILNDAPAAAGDRMTVAQLEQRMAAERIGNVAILEDERTYDEFVDGGSETTKAYYVPTDRMAFQPADGRVGSTHIAPVAREVDGLDGERLIREGRNNDLVTFAVPVNDGKEIKVESQRNCVTLLEEQRVCVIYGL